MKKTLTTIISVVLAAGLVAWIIGLVTKAEWLPWVAYPLWIAIALSAIAYFFFGRTPSMVPDDDPAAGEGETLAAEPLANQPFNGTMGPGL